MVLVKKSKVGGPPGTGAGPTKQAAHPGEPTAPAGSDSHGSLLDRLPERVAATAEELATGMAEASAAAEELRRSMEQIASGAGEAAAASQEQLAAIGRVLASFTEAREQADGSRRRTETVQLQLAEAALQITNSARAIERNAERQGSSIAIIAELDRRASDIGEVTRTISRIADQTGLLALNAAIEAARAGDHGRGFAVVADEVRTLADRSEKSAQEIHGLAQTIQGEVRGVVDATRTAAEGALDDAKSAAGIVEKLDAMREDMARVAGGSQDTLTAAMDAERAAAEAQRGAEQVASAAEQQSSAARQSQSAIEQQVRSLEQAQVATQALASLADQLRSGAIDESLAEQISASAEELSATVQELSGAASEILAAIDQISGGSQQQASATQQTSAALAQIERGAQLAQKNAGTADERVTMMQSALGECAEALERLLGGVSKALDSGRASLATIVRHEAVGRRIEKIVDDITLIAVQTSMLAVSGSVEAARAGVSGRGFAVVSKDIRSLAREAAESLERVKDTVRGILDQIGSLRRGLEQTIATAESEVQNHRAVSGALEKMHDDFAALAEANRAILQGATAILSAAAETTSGARQIAAAAEEASAASRQAATASTQQVQSAEELAAAIEEIASLADALAKQDA